jgi:hypothetical protein
VSEGQVRRYFIGLIGFAFVACWAAVGPTVAISALTACMVVVLAPDLRRKAATTRRPAPRPRAVRVRELSEEEPDELPLVPDEPSLIVEAVPRW